MPGGRGYGSAEAELAQAPEIARLKAEVAATQHENNALKMQRDSLQHQVTQLLGRDFKPSGMHHLDAQTVAELINFHFSTLEPQDSSMAYFIRKVCDEFCSTNNLPLPQDSAGKF